LEPNHFWIDPLFILGKFEEAYERTDMQIRLDPLNIDAWLSRIHSLYFNNEYDKALEYIEMLTKNDIGSYYVGIGELYLKLGKYEEAVKMTQNYFNNYPDNRPPRTLAILGLAYHHMGQEQKTEEILYELKSRSKISSVGSPSVYLSKVYAQIGRNDLAFEWLEKAYQDHETDIVGIKNSPHFEPIHNDPRWQAMLDKVGFPD
jgi:tetratricopeptide (TPR) repeat protein